MPKFDHKRRLQAIVLIFFVAGVVYAKVTGPDAAYTGAPGDLGDCTSCHDTYHFPNVGSGSVTLTGAPSIYTPEQQYNLMLTVQQITNPPRGAFGFQLTAIDQNGNRAGTLVPLSSDSQVNPVTGVGGRQYIEHTQIGTKANGPNRRTWSFRWTAPSTDVGTVVFWFAGNAADGNGKNDGDYIYTARASTDSPTSAVTVSLQSDPAGLVLQAGSHFMITWNVTGASNIDNVELRYSTDGGASFPFVPNVNPFFFTTNPEVTLYDWIVPNTPTNRAVVRVQVGKKSGDAVQALSGIFTIAGDGTTAAPKVTGALVNGKKLIVTGEGFAMGAIVELNGDAQVTANDDDFSHVLRCKKAGRKIAPGSTVTLTVLNPDGTRSAPFLFTAPVE